MAAHAVVAEEVTAEGIAEEVGLGLLAVAEVAWHGFDWHLGGFEARAQ
jgi:hypothetical protein